MSDSRKTLGRCVGAKFGCRSSDVSAKVSVAASTVLETYPESGGWARSLGAGACEPGSLVVGTLRAGAGYKVGSETKTGARAIDYGSIRC